MESQPKTTSQKSPVKNCGIELELGKWKIVAAEYGGKAVGMLVLSLDEVLICTSPA